MKYLFSSVVIFSLMLLLSCSGYGDKVTFDGTEVYYKDNVTQEMATKTGEYLQEMGFTDGSAKSVQLTKDSVYNFRMVVQKQFETDTTKDYSFMALGFLLSSEVFNGEALNFQLCDNTFKTVRNIPIEATSK
ncbi:MAG: hypothetical protein R2776_00465 [Flavobacteriaceae bacterium]|nr:hypothetical protein [Flavobacteriaceae bacterium]